MSLRQRVSSDHQLARLLQIGIVLEEVNEERARHHLTEIDADDELSTLLSEASEQSHAHRNRLEDLLEQLNVDLAQSPAVRELVDEHYAGTRPDAFDDILYDQLCSEESAYKFYDDLIEAIESSDTTYSIDRERLLAELSAIREQEREGTETVIEVLENRP